MVFDKKTRMISFRLTSGEYSEAEDRCRQNGYRSVSTLARLATLGVIPSMATIEGQEIRVITEMQAKMSEMRTDLDSIRTMFASKSESEGLQGLPGSPALTDNLH